MCSGIENDPEKWMVSMASSNLVFRDLTRYVLRILPAAAVVAMLTGTAYAQSPLMPRFSLGEGPRKLSPEEQQKKDELDNAYKQATTKIPDKQLDDPWATVRPTPSTPTPTPTPKKKQQ
jgi:hypothetical protein